VGDSRTRRQGAANSKYTDEEVRNIKIRIRRAAKASSGSPAVLE
jgi:hypothetical protein